MIGTFGGLVRFDQPALCWLVSYPKSGNTWVKVLLYRYFHASENPPEVLPDIATYYHQIVSPRPLDELTLEEQLMLRPAMLLHARVRVRRRWMLVKSHHAKAKMNGFAIFPPPLVDRAIVVVRDPRDILPSLADHMGEDLDATADFMASRTAMMVGHEHPLKHYLGSWSFHVMSWAEDSPFPVHTVRYEELHDDTEAAFTGILRFLGQAEPDADLVRECVEDASFEALRAKEEEVGFPEKSPHQERFFRRGEVGSWKHEVPDALIEKIESEHGEQMERLGYQPVSATPASA